MKNFSILSIFCALVLCCCIACSSDSKTNQAEKETISLEDIKAAQPEPIETKEKATLVNEEKTSKEETTKLETKEEKETEELTEKSVAQFKEESKKAKDRAAEIAKKEKAKAAAKKAKKKKRRKGIMKFSEKTYKFGTITEGDKVEHKFFFTNVGNKPINVKEVSATCGCTYPSHPFVPIKPGEKSYIGVTFNSKGKEGKQRPKVTVITDSDLGTFSLYMDGKVEKKEEETKATETEEKNDEN